MQELRPLDKNLPPAELCWSSGANINQRRELPRTAAAAAPAPGAEVDVAMAAARAEQEQQLAALAAAVGGADATAKALAALAALTAGCGGAVADGVAFLQSQASLDGGAPCASLHSMGSMPNLPMLATGHGLPSAPLQQQQQQHSHGLQSVQSVPMTLPGAADNIWAAAFAGVGGLQKSLSAAAAATGSPHGSGTPSSVAETVTGDWKPWSAGGSLFDAAPGARNASMDSGASVHSCLNADGEHPTQHPTSAGGTTVMRAPPVLMRLAPPPT